MPNFIIKLKDEKFDKEYYLDWSTVVDAPVTYGMTLDEYREYYQKQYGDHGMLELEKRLRRVEEKGISAHPPFDDLNAMLECNRAGDDETEIDLEGILDKYCRNN